MPINHRAPRDYLSLGRDRRRFRNGVLKIRRLLLVARVFYRRYQFEKELILHDQEPRFCVSWVKLKEIADNPQWLASGFGKFMHRLHRLARSETNEALRAYHAVSKRQQPPDRTSAHQSSPEGLP